MSLINDMLRDLERRRATASRTLPGDPTIVPPRRRIPAKSVLVTVIAGGVIIVGVAVTGVLLADRPSRHLSYTVENSPQPISESGYVPESPPAIALPSDRPAVVAAEEQARLSAVAFRSRAEGILLELEFNQPPEPARISASDDRTKILIRLDKVMIPEGFILRQPDDERLAGVTLEVTGDGIDLMLYIPEQGRVIASQAIEPLADKLHLMLSFPQVADATAAKSDVPQAPAPVPTVPSALTSAAPTASEPGVVAPVAVVRRPPPLPADQQSYQQGLMYLGTDPHAALDSFSTALTHNRGFVPARIELAKLLLQQGQTIRAEQVLLEGLAVLPEQLELRKLYARLLLTGQRHDEVVSLLTIPQAPTVMDDPEYHALLAAAYQELGHYSMAARTYTRLVQHSPREALWWFGLATSLEQQGLGAGARDAYRTALDVKGLRPDLEQFVHDRLRQL